MKHNYSPDTMQPWDGVCRATYVCLGPPQGVLTTPSVNCAQLGYCAQATLFKNLLTVFYHNC